MKQITEDFAKKFKKSYACKMGGMQTLVFPNGQEFSFDDREYYSGRGAKYNNTVRHDAIGRVEVSKKELAEQIKMERERATAIRLREKEQKEREKRYQANKAVGVYGLKTYEYGTFVELSLEESSNGVFDAERLAKTLDIAVSDALLLRSEGKTYVFAKTSTGEALELYHSDLSCNSLSICVTPASAARIAEFDHAEWSAAPFSREVGMTDAPNHFVC